MEPFPETQVGSAAMSRGTAGRWRSFIGWVSVTTVLLVVPVALADSPSHNADAVDRAGRAACLILNASKFPGIPHVADLTQTANACLGGQCLDQRTQQDGSIICHYGRSGYVAVGCQPSKRAARAYVDKLVRNHHFHRLRLNVDAAAVGVSLLPSGTASNTSQVAMALGTETVAFVMHAFSDDDPNAAWPGVRQNSIKGARNLIGTWRHLPHICSGT